jgi:hypothetical protein
MCEKLTNPLEALANELGAADPHNPVYPLLTQLITQLTNNQLPNAFVPLPRHTRYVSPEWKLSDVVPLPFGYHTSIEDALLSIRAETPVPLATDKYQVIVNPGRYSTVIFPVSNVDIVGTDRDSVILDGGVGWNIGSNNNAGAHNVDETITLSNLTLTVGMAANGNTTKNPSLLQTLRLENVNNLGEAIILAGSKAIVKNSYMSGPWIVSNATAIITGCVADSTWTLSATLGASAYIFDTTYTSNALSTDATSGIDRDVTGIEAVLLTPTSIIGIPVRYVNATYLASIVSTDSTVLSVGLGPKAVDSVTVYSPGLSTAEIVLTQRFDPLLLD